MLARRLLRFLALTVLTFLAHQLCSAATNCVPFSDARKHIGVTRCITGKVLRVQQGNRGVHFFDFCEDYRICPFTVVVFPGDLKRIGDLRPLQGRQIEIEGLVQEYDGRAEIILKRLSQLRGDAAKIPRYPRNMTSRGTAITVLANSVTPSLRKQQPRGNSPNQSAWKTSIPRWCRWSKELPDGAANRSRSG